MQAVNTHGNGGEKDKSSRVQRNAGTSNGFDSLNHSFGSYDLHLMKSTVERLASEPANIRKLGLLEISELDVKNVLIDKNISITTVRLLSAEIAQAIGYRERTSGNTGPVFSYFDADKKTVFMDEHFAQALKNSERTVKGNIINCIAQGANLLKVSAIRGSYVWQNAEIQFIDSIFNHASGKLLNLNDQYFGLHVSKSENLPPPKNTDTNSSINVISDILTRALGVPSDTFRLKLHANQNSPIIVDVRSREISVDTSLLALSPPQVRALSEFGLGVALHTCRALGRNQTQEIVAGHYEFACNLITDPRKTDLYISAFEALSRRGWETSRHLKLLSNVKALHVDNKVKLSHGSTARGTIYTTESIKKAVSGKLAPRGNFLVQPIDAAINLNVSLRDRPDPCIIPTLRDVFNINAFAGSGKPWPIQSALSYNQTVLFELHHMHGNENPYSIIQPYIGWTSFKNLTKDLYRRKSSDILKVLNGSDSIIDPTLAKKEKFGAFIFRNFRGNDHMELFSKLDKSTERKIFVEITNRFSKNQSRENPNELNTSSYLSWLSKEQGEIFVEIKNGFISNGHDFLFRGHDFRDLQKLLSKIYGFGERSEFQEDKSLVAALSTLRGEAMERWGLALGLGLRVGAGHEEVSQFLDYRKELKKCVSNCFSHPLKSDLVLESLLLIGSVPSFNISLPPDIEKMARDKIKAAPDYLFKGTLVGDGVHFLVERAALRYFLARHDKEVVSEVTKKVLKLIGVNSGFNFSTVNYAWLSLESKPALNDAKFLLKFVLVNDVLRVPSNNLEATDRLLNVLKKYSDQEQTKLLGFIAPDINSTRKILSVCPNAKLKEYFVSTLTPQVISERLIGFKADEIRSLLSGLPDEMMSSLAELYKEANSSTKARAIMYRGKYEEIVDPLPETIKSMVGGDMLENYYRILAVPRNATEEEILKSYRTLSKVFHPDLFPDEDVMPIFKLLAEAHTVIGNKEMRPKYDQQLPNYIHLYPRVAWNRGLEEI